jgi:aminoglycoside 6'-N-acetyltransferase I
VKSRYGLEIRAATSADAPAVGELLSTAGHAVSPVALARRLEAIRQGSGTALLAMEWGPPSGIVVLHWFHVLDADQPAARITTLLVGLGERRRGIGRLLLKAASQAARVAGCDTLELSADPADLTLSGFCLATGFTEGDRCFIRPLRKKTLL